MPSARIAAIAAYVAKCIEKIIGTPRDPWRPKETVWEDAFEYAEKNGILKQPYFRRFKTAAMRRELWMEFCAQHWGGVDGLRSHFLPAIGCPVAYLPYGIRRGNRDSMIASHDFANTCLDGTRVNDPGALGRFGGLVPVRGGR